ncbi:TB2/DP1, HVA22 family-domain-containing protein [Lanmaoa asiatica]|nr:TB2/DP1, HVA22 family-domain-containing protein [Lanmaoa asiatica]
MSAAQKVQQHPVFIQAQNKVNYHLSQLDKEVRISVFYPFLSDSDHPLSLSGQLTKYPVLNTFEQHTQVPKTFLAIGTILLLALFHFINPLAAPVSNLVGWALPACLSFKALERPAPQDDVQWLTYWVVFGFLNFAESIASGIILYYVPWYYALKTVFVLWLQLPNFRGAQVVYVTVLKPVLANVSGSSRAVAPTDTVAAEGLRDRVNTATAD